MTAQLAVESNTEVKPHVVSDASLDALTALRFFAAAGIVLFHTMAAFGVDYWHWMSHQQLAMCQGVSFFFVLSGFILTRVYPSLPDFKGVLAFWRARVARIWPTHILCLILQAFAGPTHVVLKDWALVLASACLAQSWFPDKKIFFYLNPPAWSLSAEVFFYACFPLLLIGMRKHRVTTLGASFLLLLTMITIAELGICVMPYNSVYSQTARYGLDGLLFINPLARLFEFVVGMWLAHALQSDKMRAVFQRHGVFSAGLALVLIAAVIAAPFYVGPSKNGMLAPVACWFMYSGGVFPYALLIAAVTAFYPLTKILRSRLLVRLGNTSYAMYLLHVPLMYFFIFRVPKAGTLLGWPLYGMFWAVLLLASDLLYSAFETPLRHLIARGCHATAPRHQLFTAAVEIASIAGLFVIFFSRLHTLRVADQSSVKAIQQATPECARNVSFDRELKLEGIRLSGHSSLPTCKLELAWSTTKPTLLSKVVAVHLIDSRGQIRKTLDTYQDTAQIYMLPGDRWKDVIDIPKASLDKAYAIGIAVYPRGRVDKLLTVDGGSRDWGSRRLYVPLALMDTDAP